jgi:membrane fusion protein (multidrug efflux system)
MVVLVRSYPTEVFYMRIHKRYMAGLFILSVIAATQIAGCGNDAPQVRNHAQEVSVWEVSTRPVKLTTELSGRTSAVEVAEVRPQVTGIIQKRLFTEGQKVEEGQQLYQIDPAVYEAALSEAKAALLQAQANYNADRLLAERNTAALKVHAVSRQEYDNAVAAKNRSYAQVVAAKASVDTASINIRYTKVNAPISGYIGISSVTPGALVTANQAQSIATIQRLDEMYVDVTQSSAEILRLKRSLMEGRLASAGDGGAVVGLKLEDGTRYEQTGTLQLTDISVDTGTGAITVRAKFTNPKNEISPGRFERLLFPGMFVRAILQEAVNENAVMAPQVAVGRDTMGRATVYVVNAENTVVEEVVTVERSVGSEFLLSSGLKPGQKLIIDGRIKVRPGMKVATVAHPTEKDANGNVIPVISIVKQAAEAAKSK